MLESKDELEADLEREKEANMAKGNATVHTSHPSNIALLDKAQNGRWYAICFKCTNRPLARKISIKASTGINKLMSIWKQKGWKHHGRTQWECPECQKKKQPGNGQEIDMEKVERLQNDHAATTNKARKAKRSAIEFLEEFFNDETGRFEEGCSDITIGEAVGLSPQVIATIREELFGELKAPSELENIQKELAEFVLHNQQMADNFSKRINKLEEKFK